jgi:long-subunit fatty acid transport protein
MKHTMTGVAALLLSASPLLAGGIERAPQSLSALFEEGNYAELSFGGADPTVSGTDSLGYDTGDVAQGYGFVGLAYKQQFTPEFSGAIIIEQPFGADMYYTPFAEGGSYMLGGTKVQVDSTTFTALARYEFVNNFSIHGGIRGSRANGDVTLNGAAYGAVAGYNAKMDDVWGVGYVIGGAYEIPDIAGRISLTYNSKIDHDFDTVETISGMQLGPESVTTVSTPESVNLEFQSGVAADTLVFGSIRWVNWSEFLVDPQIFTATTGAGLVELEDTTTYTLGVARKFTDAWSGAASFAFEPSGDDLVSPLAPTNGRTGITLAAIYTQNNIKVTTAVNYSRLGDAQPQTAGTARAQMEDGDLWGVGVKIGYSF